MGITRLEVDDYRSLRRLRLRLSPLTVLVGGNGCGKTNCYRALRLLAAAAEGRLAATMAEEGGMPSALWAGKRRRGEVRMRLGVTLDAFSYRLALGLPRPERTLFTRDPEVKEEDIEAVAGRRRIALVRREGAGVRLRGEAGGWEAPSLAFEPAESLLAQLVDPVRWPELALLRQTLSSWRFYHQFRSDAGSPLRQPRVGVRTRALAHDGADLAAALQTIVERGRDELDAAIDAALPGAEVVIAGDDQGRLWVELASPGMHRRVQPYELSDGQLRLLCLAAACLATHAPPLMVLNEPETSLHEDLIPALAGLIASAARRGQVVVTTHDRTLAELLRQDAGAAVVPLTTAGGETRVEGDEHLVFRAEDEG